MDAMKQTPNEPQPQGSTPRPQSLRRLLARSLELLASMAVVLVFFLAFLGLLKVVFPSGTSLSQLMAPGTEEQERSGGLWGTAPEQFEPSAAVLSRVQNSVKSKGSAEIAWRDAGAGKSLFNQDAVQTLNHSSATITFNDKNRIELGGNSLVVVKSLERSRSRDRHRAVLVMHSGEARGTLDGTGAETVAVELATPSATTRIGPAGRGTNFAITVNPDHSSTISVFTGMAEVMAQGKRVRVGANLTTTVLPGKAPGRPNRLPTVPNPTLPREGDSIAYRDLPPRLSFAWQGSGTGFRVVVARDADFSQVVADERVSEASFFHGNLKEGEYFWKVSGTDGWSQGLASPVRRFRLVRDQEPPPLQVAFPGSAVAEPRVTLAGSTEPGATVFVNNQKVVVTGPEGEFSHSLELHRGINVIVVEAVDAAGNITYRSHKVRCTLQEG